MTSKLLLLLLVCFGLLAGCATHVKVDTRLVEILPDSIAHGIIEKKLGTEWANAPYVVKRGSCSIFTTNEPISFKDINFISYNPTLGILSVMTQAPESTFLHTCLHRIGFDLNENDAKEVVAALKSLGACTSINVTKTC